jgi:hypothetical protein
LSSFRLHKSAWPYKILVRKREEMRPLGRRRGKYEDNIKTDI